MRVLLLLLVHLLFSSTIGTLAYNPEAPGSANGRNKRLPFLRQQDMVGVWKLRHSESLLPVLTSKTSDNPNHEHGDGRNIGRDVVVRLNDDGSFNRYGDSYVSIAGDSNQENECDDDDDDTLANTLGRGGTWTYREDESTLLLAPDRPDNIDARRIHDTLLSGKLMATSTKQIVEPIPSQHDEISADERSTISGNKDSQKVDGAASSSIKPLSSASPGLSNGEDKDKTIDFSSYDIHLSVPEGQVAIGKFMYPKHHKEFFEEPMLFRESVIGTFSLRQLLGNLNTRLQQEQQKRLSNNRSSDEGGYHKRDFYGKRFYLTSTPLPVNPDIAKRDKRYDPMNTLHDFRVMPITFHSNNTFTAFGSDKILRGRFGITGSARDRLWFQVNLFGAGRSAPGSVHSEGRGLSQEDRRGYRGLVQEYARPRNKTDEVSIKSPSNEIGGSRTLLKNNSTTIVSDNANQTMLMFVEGNVFYGNDMGIHKRPSVTATFSLQEICGEDEDFSGDDEEEEEDDEEIDDDPLDGAFQ